MTVFRIVTTDQANYLVLNTLMKNIYCLPFPLFKLGKIFILYLYNKIYIQILRVFGEITFINANVVSQLQILIELCKFSPMCCEETFRLLNIIVICWNYSL